MANTKIKQQVDAIDKQIKRLAKMKTQLQSKCTHTVRGDLDLAPDRDYKENSLHFVCRQCQKTLNLNRLQDDEIKNACDVLDRAIDTIKIALDPNREDDYKTLKAVAKTQHRVRTMIKPYYDATLKKSARAGRRGNNRRNGRRGSNNIWDSPGTLR